MIQLNQQLDSLSLPWDSTKKQDDMTIFPMDAYLSDLQPPFEPKDLALIDKEGQLTGWVPFAKLTEALFNSWQSSTHLYNALIQTVEDAVTVIDENANVVSWNESAEELYHCSKEEIIGKPITNFFKEESLMLIATLKHGTIIEHQYNQSRSDIHVLVSTQPLYLRGQLVGGISVERNINDLVRLNEGLASKTAYIQDLEHKMETMNAREPFYKIKGRSQKLMNAVKLAKKVAMTDASVLITGESGVGKELFAQAIHKAGSRSDKPFVDLNCGAIPYSLFESELFGYEKGAFTGAAKEGKKGRFDLAKGGTLFLDEIGELPLDLQVKLLRVLQEKKFYRVGGNTSIPFDVRIVSATNRSLENMITEGSFRQDLYYRLNVVSIQIPSLRDRIDDIPELIQLFLQEFAHKYHKPIPTIDTEVMYTFLHSPWKGNIRQLRNTLEHMMILTDEEGLQPHHLPQGLQKNQQLQDIEELKHYKTLEPSHTSLADLSSSHATYDYDIIRQALEKTYGNKSAAAKLLGISRVTLYNKIRKYNL